MDGTIRIRGLGVPRRHRVLSSVSDTELGRGSFLGHGFRVARGASRDVVRVEVYSRDRWWVMCRATGLSGSVLTFVWDRAWLRVGRPWRDGVEDAVAGVLVGVRDAV